MKMTDILARVPCCMKTGELSVNGAGKMKLSTELAKETSGPVSCPRMFSGFYRTTLM